MNKYLFLYFILNISISLCFNPIPKGNGIPNSNYSHHSTDNLYFVFEHFRHGARSPCEGEFINKKDELGGNWESYGTLTKEGIKQQFLLGKKNRKHYKHFISKEYIPNEIRVYSTNYNRTIMSAQAQLLGFYKNLIKSDSIKFEDIINDKKNLDEFNFHSIIPEINLYENEENNNLILFKEKFECKYHKQMLAKNMEKLHEFKIFNKINEIREKFNQKYIQIFSKEFNKPNYTRNYKGFYKFCDIYIAFYFDEKRNKEIIDNLEKKYDFFNSKEILNMCYDFYYEKFLIIESEEYAKDNYKIIMSRTLNKIINIMKIKKEKNDPNFINKDLPKFLLYSGHDDTLTQMQIFLNKHFDINKEWVPFASNQIFELRKYGDIFYIEIYYNDKLKMNITFDQFYNIVNKNIISENEINEKCYGIRNSIYFSKFLMLLLIAGILFISFIFLNVWVCFKGENVKSEKVPKIIMIN